jgi:hypothetical protein
MKSVNRLANVISYLFHPLLMPTLGLLVIFNSGSFISNLPFEIKRMAYITVFIGTFILPISIIPFFLFGRLVSSIKMSNRGERVLPLAITALLYYISFFIMTKSSIGPVVTIFMLATAVIVTLVLGISFFWKISAHLAGIGGITGLIISLTFRLKADLMSYLVIILIIAGLVSLARLLLDEHNPAQVYSGFLLGLITMIVIFYIF